MRNSIPDNAMVMNRFSLHYRCTGFTLIELMITVSLLAILLGIAAPSLRDLLLNVRMAGQSNDFLTDLSIARSEAVKRDVRAGLCVSTDGASCTTASTQWADGWIVFVDADVDQQPDGGVPLKRTTGLDSNTLTRSDNPGNGLTGIVAFAPSGALTASAGAAMFELRDARGCGRNITVSNTGRPSAVKVAVAGCS